MPLKLPSKPSSAFRFIALDPGLNNPAVAIFHEGRLIHASRVKVEASWKLIDIGERTRRVANVILDHVYVSSIGLPPADQLVFERPQIYRAAKSKGDPNDLPPLFGVGMCLAGRMDIPVVTYTPQQWAGSTKKITTGDPTESARARLILRNLSKDEQNTIVLSHDAIDAVGIGLHHLGRLARRVYHGCTEVTE